MEDITVSNLVFLWNSSKWKLLKHITTCHDTQNTINESYSSTIFKIELNLVFFSHESFNANKWRIIRATKAVMYQDQLESPKLTQTTCAVRHAAHELMSLNECDLYLEATAPDFLVSMARVKVHLGFAADLVRLEAVFASGRGSPEDLQGPHFHAANQGSAKLATEFAASEAVVDEVGRGIENKQDFFNAGQDKRPLWPGVTRVFS